MRVFEYRLTVPASLALLQLLPAIPHKGFSHQSQFEKLTGLDLRH